MISSGGQNGSAWIACIACTTSLNQRKIHRRDADETLERTILLFIFSKPVPDLSLTRL